MMSQESPAARAAATASCSWRSAVGLVGCSAGGDDAPEGRGVARRGGRRVEAVQSVLGSGAADLHADEGTRVLHEHRLQLKYARQHYRWSGGQCAGSASSRGRDAHARR